MTFRIRKASDSYLEEEKTVEIHSIEDLKRLDDENENCGLIIGFYNEPSIVIYDDYVE